MADIKQKAYDGVASVLTTELNALGVASYSNASSAINNSSALNLFDDLELVVDFVSAPTAGGYVSVYLLPAVDGSNYADGSSSIVPAAQTLVATIDILATTAAQRLSFRNVPIPPGLFKYMVANNTDQAFPATGSTLKRNPHSMSVT
jgi:hypothetical protein